MTTVSTATRSDSLLRLAMRADAVLSGLCGIALIAAAGPLSGFTGLPTGVEYGIGAAFVVYATVVYLAAGLRRRCARPASPLRLPTFCSLCWPWRSYWPGPST